MPPAAHEPSTRRAPYRSPARRELAPQLEAVNALDRTQWLAKLCALGWVVVRLGQSVAWGRLLEAGAALLIITVAVGSGRTARRALQRGAAPPPAQPPASA